MEQEKVWNKIARPWKSFREKPLKEVSDFTKGKKGNVLDLGCGSGRHFFKLKGKIYAVDFSKEMLKLAEKHSLEEGINVETIKTEMYKLPFKDNFFDSAMFIASLHCVESEKKRKKSLEELHRVLKKKGRAIITVWSRNQERIKNKPKEALIPWTVEGKQYLRYYYIYDKKEFENLLKSAGFKIVSIKENKNIVAIVEK